jgi:Leucine-rich repeat (LRR) protein
MPTQDAIQSSTSDAREQSEETLAGKLVAGSVRVANSWLGLVAAYATAVGAVILAFSKKPEILQGLPIWLQTLVFLSPFLLVLIFHTIPQLIDQRRRRMLTEIHGSLKAGYFQLSPRSDELSFDRPDGKHTDIFRWIESSDVPLLYLTGLSGCGKTSLLTASALPQLERAGMRIVKLRGYQNITAMVEELKRSGIIWKKAAPDVADLRVLLERACSYVAPARLLLVLDQFEEFVIIQDSTRQQAFTALLLSLCESPIKGLTVLLVFRSDYTGLIEKLSLPYLVQDSNWKEVPPFTESAVKSFIGGSGIVVSEDLLSQVLREVAELEQTRGFIRPITMNLCGLVLGRFATGLPRGFRPGRLIRGFLEESVNLPAIREISPRVVPLLISSYLTKRPRSIEELSKLSGVSPLEVRGCLRMLGQSDRAIVRPLDSESTVWEIAHDFLAPLLDSIFARWRVGFWRRARPWVPWFVAGTALIFTAVFSTLQSSPNVDPLVALRLEGWKISNEGGAGWGTIDLEKNKEPTTEECRHIRRINGPVGLLFHDTGTFDLNTLRCVGVKNVTFIRLENTKVTNFSALNMFGNLQILELYHTDVQDLSPIASLFDLLELDILDSPVKDLSPFRYGGGFSHLKNLQLDNTAVDDISPLQNLESVRVLTLRGAKVTDLTPLKNIVTLSWLVLSNTPIRDLSPLSNLSQLQILDLRNTPVTDLTPLKDLPQLDEVDLEGTHVIDLGPIEHRNIRTTSPFKQ